MKLIQIQRNILPILMVGAILLIGHLAIADPGPSSSSGSSAGYNCTFNTSAGVNDFGGQIRFKIEDVNWLFTTTFYTSPSIPHGEHNCYKTTSSHSRAVFEYYDPSTGWRETDTIESIAKDDDFNYICNAWSACRR